MRVLRSDDDVLYLVGGSNDVLRLYGEAGFSELVPVASWRARLAARAAFFAGLGIPWRQFLVPEKLSVIGEAVLARQIPGAVPPGERLMRELDHPALVYPLEFLREQHRSGFLLYPRTDSHWTSLGALCGFQWLLSHIGHDVDFAPFLAAAPVAMTYRGDLWGEGFDGMPLDLFERRAVPDTVVRNSANALVLLKERHAPWRTSQACTSEAMSSTATRPPSDPSA